jgi:hypothetical protein
MAANHFLRMVVLWHVIGKNKFNKKCQAMKKGRLNTAAWIRMAACSLVLAFAPGAFAQQATMVSSGVHQVKKDKADVREDVEQIRHDKGKITAIKTQMRQDRKADNKRATMIERKDLAKACADKKRDVAHLKADRRDIKRSDNLAIRESRKSIRKDRAGLASNRRALRKKEHMRKGDTATDIEDEADRVTYYQQKLDQDKERLTHQRRKKEEDMTFMRKEEKRLQEKQSPSYTAR